MSKQEGYIYNAELAEDHRRYLEGLYEHDEKRLQAIESKVLSIIGQSGLIISLLSLSLNLVKEASDRSIALTDLLIACYVAALIFYVWSIVEATKVLAINNFKYQTGSTKTVSKNHQRRDEFREEEIRDLIRNIGVNRQLTNDKGTHLLRARSSFRTALIITAVFGSLMAIALLQCSIPWCWTM